MPQDGQNNPCGVHAAARWAPAAAPRAAAAFPLRTCSMRRFSAHNSLLTRGNLAADRFDALLIEGSRLPHFVQLAAELRGKRRLLAL